MRRIALIAEGPTAQSALASLAAQFHICAVFRSARDPQDPVAAGVARRGWPLVSDTAPRNIHAAIEQLKPDCVVVSSYHRILGAETLGLCPFLNVHYGALPAYRGRATVNWAILNGERETAITIHQIDAGLDSGNIFFQRSVPITHASTAGTLYEQLNEIQTQELAGAVGRLLSGDKGAEQRGLATYCCTRLPEDGEIRWSDSTGRIDSLIRALTPPFPGAYTYLDLQRLIVLRAEIVPDPPAFAGRIPGRVARVCKKSGKVQVLTGDGLLAIEEVSTDGADRHSAADVIRSTKQTLGLTTHALVTKIGELNARLARYEESRFLPAPEPVLSGPE